MKTFELEKLKRRVSAPTVERNIDSVIVHHTASSVSTTFKQIYRWHTIENGWSMNCLGSDNKSTSASFTSISIA